jgi:hypothetical protein
LGNATLRGLEISALMNILGVSKWKNDPRSLSWPIILSFACLGMARGVAHGLIIAYNHAIA